MQNMLDLTINSGYPFMFGKKKDLREKSPPFSGVTFIFHRLAF
jgi:hypothetical protein